MTERSRALPTGWPPLTKGHGTGNDFLLLTDADAALAIRPEQVAAVADRRLGIGADGVIRAVRTLALCEHDPGVAELVAAWPQPLPEWFLDYRNGDGSIAEMCGNGLRVFVRYLLAQGLLSLAPGQRAVIGTRAGPLEVWLSGDEVGETMGRFAVPGGADALAAGADAVVRISDASWPGLSVTMPNPHVAFRIADDDDLAALDLTRPPEVSPPPAEGANVEAVQLLGVREGPGGRVGVLRMRVHERGVGETLSCGTGACAAAVAARAWSGPDAPENWEVQVPGGVLGVRVGPDDSVELTGPAELVATLRLVP